MKFHKNPEQFKCQICGYQAKSKGDLKKHLKTHDKNREKNFKCNQNQCDFKTDFKGSLKTHSKVHQKVIEKAKNSPYVVKCQKCPSVLKNQLSYRCHMSKIHGNRKKPQCDFCGLELAHKNSLRRHFVVKHSKN
jgi:KRAB domain-containing zinc finger protein